MLKKNERISKDNEFKEVREKGEMKATPLFSVVYILNPPLTPPLINGGENKLLINNNRKFGTIVSKKISKKAVERNQIRRRLMEAVRKNKEKFPEGFRGIFLVKKSILGKSEMEIEEWVKKLF